MQISAFAYSWVLINTYVLTKKKKKKKKQWKQDDLLINQIVSNIELQSVPNKRL